jgi:glycolate oxidase
VAFTPGQPGPGWPAGRPHRRGRGPAAGHQRRPDGPARELDVVNRRAWVEPGLVNARLGRAAAAHGLRFAPDPASQIAATLGGNVATNAGGIHVFTYGVMSQHVLAVELMDADGEIHLLDGRRAGAAGLDLRGVSVGGEGTLGIVTARACGCCPPRPPSARCWPGSPRCGGCRDRRCAGHQRPPARRRGADGRPGGVAGRGLRPGRLPGDAAAVLLLEFEGLPARGRRRPRDRPAPGTRRTARPRSPAPTAPEQRARIWKGRKAVAGAIAKRAPDFFLQDVVVPRSRLGEMLDEVVAIGEREGLEILNVVHAGDGNLHPFVLFDRREEGVLDRVFRRRPRHRDHRAASSDGP